MTTAQKTDKIYAMDDGAIVECGKHEELVSNPSGHYKKF